MEGLEGQRDPCHYISRWTPRRQGSVLGYGRRDSDDDDLETPGDGWISPDRKLAAALAKVSEGGLGRQLALASNAAFNNGRVARGRVLLRTVFQYYSSGMNAELMYDISHLQRIAFRGEHLKAFSTIGRWL